MGLNDIMKGLSVFGEDMPIPRETLAEAVRQREAVTPLLLDRLDWLWENVREREDEVYGDPEYGQSMYALFLLAQFGEKLAYPKLLRLLRLEEGLLEIALDDVIDSMGDMLYSTFDGDLDSAKALAADASLVPYARAAAVELMVGLAGDGRMSREELAGFIRERLAAIGDSEDEELFAALLANAAVNAKLFELMEDIWQAYRQGKVDLSFNGDFESFIDALFMETEPRDRTRRIEDVATELAEWACFAKDAPSKPDIFEIQSWKVGRNDPCPCGSGKKFKKCCLKRLEEWELQAKQQEQQELDSYPPITGRNGRPGLGDYFSREAIAVDEPAYRAMKLLYGPTYRSRAEEHQAKRRARELLLSAYQQMRRICDERDLETPEEFDESFHVHYECAQWLDALLELMDSEDPRRPEVEEFLYSSDGE